MEKCLCSPILCHRGHVVVKRETCSIFYVQLLTFSILTAIYTHHYILVALFEMTVTMGFG